MAAGATLKHKRKTGAFLSGELEAGEWGLDLANDVWYYSLNGTTVSVLKNRNNVIVPLTDAPTITVDASLGSLFRVTLGGDRTLQNPSNLTDGQVLTFEIVQDATGFRRLMLDTLYIGFIPYLYASPPNSRFFVSFRYNQTEDKLYLENCWLPANVPQKQFLPREQFVQQAATLIGINLPTPTLVGTASSPSPATTNLHQSIRLTRITSAATANSASEIRASSGYFWRGNANSMGGFYSTWTWAFNSTLSNQATAVGLWGNTGATSTTQVPSAILNGFWFGNDAGDSNLQLMHNDGTGTANKVDLGANFPANSTTPLYRGTFWCYPNHDRVNWELERLDTGLTVSGVITTDLVSNTTFLVPHAYMNNGGNAVACVLDIRGFANWAIQ